MSAAEDLLKSAHRRLRLYKSKSQETFGPKKAAVLICLFAGKEDGGDLRVILTRRSSNMSSHSGEIALPGGKWEEGDKNAVDTALREAKEEIGLGSHLVDVVTVLEPFYTKIRVTVFPVVAIMWERERFEPIPNGAEVETVFDAPLEMFLKNEHRRQVEKEWKRGKYLLHSFHHRVGENTYLVWAFTAAILVRVASLVYERPPAFEERNPEFWHESKL